MANRFLIAALAITAAGSTSFWQAGAPGMRDGVYRASGKGMQQVESTERLRKVVIYREGTLDSLIAKEYLADKQLKQDKYIDQRRPV